MQTIATLLEIPPAEREAVVGLSLRITPPNTETYVKRKIIQTIAEIPPAEREAVARLASCVSPPQATVYMVRQIIETIAEIPQAERESVVRFALQISIAEADGLDRVDYMRVVQQTPLAERESIVKLILQISPMGTVTYVTRKMIATLLKIPQAERESVVGFALRIGIPEVEVEELDIIDCIEIVYKIPKAERESVISLASKIISPGIGEERRAHAVAMIRSFSAEQRVAISRLKTLGMSEQNLYRIMYYMLHTNEGFEFPPDQEAFFFDTTLWIFNEIVQGGIRNEDVLPLIHAIAASIPDNAHQIPGVLQRIDERMDTDAKVLEIIGRLNQLRGTNVHAANRDLATRDAVERLYETQGNVAPGAIENAKEEFSWYLNELCRSGNNPQALRARHALLGQQDEGEIFGPLIGGEKFSVVGRLIDGAQLVGRLWLFIQTLGSPEKENAKSGMVTALADSYEGNVRVCNPGKVQRLAVAVLQGRLDGVNVEGISFNSEDMPELSIADAINLFFAKEEIRAIDNRGSLIQEAEQFLRNNPRVPRDDFIAEVERYCLASGM